VTKRLIDLDVDLLARAQRELNTAEVGHGPAVRGGLSTIPNLGQRV